MCVSEHAFMLICQCSLATTMPSLVLNFNCQEFPPCPRCDRFGAESFWAWLTEVFTHGQILCWRLYEDSWVRKELQRSENNIEATQMTFSLHFHAWKGLGLSGSLGFWTLAVILLFIGRKKNCQYKYLIVAVVYGNWFCNTSCVTSFYDYISGRFRALDHWTLDLWLL